MLKKLFHWIKNLLFGEKIKSESSVYGFITSPKDYRDIPLSAISASENPTPPLYRIPFKLPVKNQGSDPSCVGFAGSYIKEYLEWKETGSYVEFDGLWLYKECKKIDNMPLFKGTFFRSVLKVLYNKGAMPVGGNEEDVEKYRIGGYAKIEDTSPESIKRAIYIYGAILLGFRGSNGGWRSIIIRKPEITEEQWGHAIAGEGFEVDYIDGLNQWGEKYHDKGRLKIPSDYEPVEAWAVLTDLPNNWKELIPNKEDKPKYQFVYDLMFGQTNQQVVALQNCLKYEGCMSKDTPSTGYFGIITLNAVKLFQGRYNITPVKGYVGIKTRTKLNQLFN